MLLEMSNSAANTEKRLEILQFTKTYNCLMMQQFYFWVHAEKNGKHSLEEIFVHPRS